MTASPESTAGYHTAEDDELRNLREIGERAHSRRETETSQRFMKAADSLPGIMGLAEIEAVLLADLTLAYGQDVDPDDEEAVEQHQAALDRLSAEFVGNEALVARKVERYIHVLEVQDMMVSNFKARAKRMRDHAAAIENGQEKLKQWLITAMLVMDRKQVVTPSGVVSLRQNPPHVDIANEPVVATVEAYETMPGVPPEFVRLIQLYKVDKRALAAAIKARGEVPGATVSRGERLDWK